MSAIKDLFRNGPAEVRRRIMEYRQNRVKVDRPDWDHYLMNIAKETAKRSSDSQSKFGSVIVNSNNEILGTGYNGPVAGIDDSYIPNIRPYKYFAYLHSEINSICSCTHRPDGGKIYITGKPCCHCLQVIAQAGIKEIIYLNKSVAAMCKDPNEEVNFTILSALLENKVKIRVLDD